MRDVERGHTHKRRASPNSTSLGGRSATRARLSPSRRTSPQRPQYPLNTMHIPATTAQDSGPTGVVPVLIPSNSVPRLPSRFDSGPPQPSRGPQLPPIQPLAPPQRHRPRAQRDGPLPDLTRNNAAITRARGACNNCRRQKETVGHKIEQYAPYGPTLTFLSVFMLPKVKHVVDARPLKLGIDLK